MVRATLGALLLGGCALLGPGAVAPTSFPADLPAHVELTEAPFFAQDDYQCGPAALATVLSAAGVARTPDQLVDQVYLPQRQGSLQPEMMAAARRAGLLAYPLAPDPQALLREVAAGHPVLVLQNLRWDIYPQWHYAVVIGYDRAADERYLRSGVQRRRVEPGEEFERSWSRAGRWAFVALAPDRLPATATADAYVAAAAALERSVPDAAAIAYRTALGRWPENLVARLGLGNIAYAQHRLEDAQAQYRRAADEHPDAADAWNNLAQALHELGRDGEALPAARRAVQIGGPRAAEYRDTLHQIDAPAGR
jgi:tetratricopeptide (TPR) repeat protein